MKDKNGEVLKSGDRFKYEAGEHHEYSGEIFDCGGVDVIKWDDNNEIISVKDFYHASTDQSLLLKL